MYIEIHGKFDRLNEISYDIVKSQKWIPYALSVYCQANAKFGVLSLWYCYARCKFFVSKEIKDFYMFLISISIAAGRFNIIYIKLKNFVIELLKWSKILKIKSIEISILSYSQWLFKGFTLMKI